MKRCLRNASSGLLRSGRTTLALLFSILLGAVANAGGSPEKCPIGDVTKDISRPFMNAPVYSKKKQAWERALGGRDAARPHIQARLRGWPATLLVDRMSLVGSDEDFAWRVARDTWRGIDAFADRESGLPVDNVRFGANSVLLANSRIGDYTSSTDIGLYLIAVTAARDLEFISNAEAEAKIRTVLGTLAQLETHKGFFFNYYDTTALERTSNFLSFVDSAWLTTGLIVVRQAFPELRESCTELIDRSDYGFFYNRKTKQISHGYYVKPGTRSPYDYGLLYAEARLGALIAIGKGDIPEDAWFRMRRVYPASCAWQPVTPLATTKTVRGHRIAAGYATWKNIRYVPSWGGSLFEALMPLVVLDEPRLVPKSLGANDRAHVEIQRRYAAEELAYPVWGISPCATPEGDGYQEYGVPILGARGYPAGAVTPHASALALGVAPREALANLRELARRYEIYGEYGFYDAVDPRSGRVAHKYLALDQSMLFVALANHLRDGCVQKWFAADPIIQRALPIVAEEDFFE